MSQKSKRGGKSKQKLQTTMLHRDIVELEGFGFVDKFFYQLWRSEVQACGLLTLAITLSYTDHSTVLTLHYSYFLSLRSSLLTLHYSPFLLHLRIEYRSLTMYLYTHTLTHSHTMLITCTCCYDLTKGTQDKDFSDSFSILTHLTLCHSLPLTHFLFFIYLHNLLI